MPEPMVREDLQRGRLVQLDMPEYKNGFIRLHAIYRTDTPPGPAGSWLIARFEAQASEAAEAANRRAVSSASRDRRKRSARARRAAVPCGRLQSSVPLLFPRARRLRAFGSLVVEQRYC